MIDQIMEPYRMRQNRVDASQRFYLEAVMLIQKSGAAIAFNSIYKILREEPQFIDKHWLELFYYFINNLALCTSPGDNQILCESINHLSRVVKEKSQMFTKPNASRSKPNRFESLTLRSFLEYLSENLTRSFINNLALCTSPGDNQILCESINHLSRVVKEKSQTFTKSNASRSKPNRFESLTLRSFLEYLSENLTRANAFLRSAARKIVTTLSPHCAEFAMETELPRIQKLLESQLEDVSHFSEKDVFQLSEDIRVLNIALENELWLLSDFKDHTKTIVGLLLSPDSKLLITINRVLKQLNTASEGSITDSKRCVNERVSPNSVAGLSTLIVNLLKLTVKLDGNTLRALLPDGQQIESSIEDNCCRTEHPHRQLAEVDSKVGRKHTACLVARWSAN
ncbi:uncharacterized protein LOC113470183 [Diaphorina citri]|uniref:Uncharacterized protein LOC113470183 n=1 Tax=Diaphorina citri TaxID=121845 RepID=A0A3Q0JBX0_DIACI|nr:uncharacterized protein LOC113470183 [Diaphorina citri]